MFKTFKNVAKKLKTCKTEFYEWYFSFYLCIVGLYKLIGKKSVQKRGKS